MAEGLAEFLRSVGPEFDGKAQLILDATGAVSVEELLELVDSREDLRDLDKEEVGMKALHVKKLFKAIMQAKERGAPAPAPAAAAAPPPSSPQDATGADTRSAAVPPQVFPKLEKLMSTVPEDSVKEPSYYVACSDASKHTEMKLPSQQVSSASGAYPSSEQKEKVPLPDPMSRGPLLFNQPAADAADTAAKASKPRKFQPMYKDFPSLGPAGAEPEVTRAARTSGAGKAAAERAMQAAELARLAAEQAEQAAADAGLTSGRATAANAALAQQMLRDRRQAYNLRKEAYDRVVEFVWDLHTYKFANGRAQHGVPSPISELSEEGFQAAFAEGLKAFCQANQPDQGLEWAVPEIEEWILHEPKPAKSKKGKEVRPYALVMFKSIEDVQYLEHIYSLRAQVEDPAALANIPPMKIEGQVVAIQRPNPDFVRRVDSSRGSETASQAGSVAGSENSHSSTSHSEYRNLTLLFMNLPEAVHSSLSQRPAAKLAIEAYVASVLNGPSALPIPRESVKFSASFAEPRKAPYGGCWLTFRYSDEKKRINPDDGKPYTFEALKKLYGDTKAMKLWSRGTDAVFELEKQLGGRGQKPVSIARWVLSKIQEKQVQPPPGAEKGSTWTECEVRGSRLSVQFKRG